jgi:hypothetical protein
MKKPSTATDRTYSTAYERVDYYIQYGLWFAKEEVNTTNFLKKNGTSGFFRNVLCSPRKNLIPPPPVPIMTMTGSLVLDFRKGLSLIQLYESDWPGIYDYDRQFGFREAGIPLFRDYCAPFLP